MAALTAACLAVDALPAAAQAAPDLTGVWWATTVPDRLAPDGGGTIPFTPEGKAAYDKRRADLKSGAFVDRSVHICLPRGLPRAWITAYPIQILQTPDQVTALFEENRQVHIIRMIAKHFDPDFWDPSYMGEAIAHWDGDVLVVDATNFNDDTMLDGTGLPHSDKLHVTERLRLLNNGKRLEVVATIEDPQMYAKPWSARFSYERRDGVQVATDWVCGEPHRDVSAVRRVSAGK